MHAAGVRANGVSTVAVNAARNATLSDIAASDVVSQESDFCLGAVEEDSLKLWWKRATHYPLLSGEREIELAKRIEAGDTAAFDEMVECNLRLVGAIARKCRRYGGQMTLADLIQEGSLGLMRAVEKFDHRKGFKFSTYASYWIRQAVQRAIDEQSRSIRLPVHISESMTKSDRARAILTQELERPPSNREIANYLRISESKMQDLSRRACEPISLDICLGDTDDSNLADFIPDHSAPSPLDCATRAALREEIERAFCHLTPREAEVLCLRYGFDENGSARTLDEVGAELKLTRERIRQIERSALKRLQRSNALRETVHHEGSAHSLSFTAPRGDAYSFA